MTDRIKLTGDNFLLQWNPAHDDSYIKIIGVESIARDHVVRQILDDHETVEELRLIYVEPNIDFPTITKDNLATWNDIVYGYILHGLMNANPDIKYGKAMTKAESLTNYLFKAVAINHSLEQENKQLKETQLRTDNYVMKLQQKLEKIKELLNNSYLYSNTSIFESNLKEILDSQESMKCC